MLKVGIVGTRRRDSLEDMNIITQTLDQVTQENEIDVITRKTVMIVSGGCPHGGDRFAEMIAISLGLTILIHYPAWRTAGRGAGFMRNSLIANDCDVLIACVAGDRTGGTEDTIKKVEKLGKTVYLC